MAVLTRALLLTLDNRRAEGLEPLVPDAVLVEVEVGQPRQRIGGHGGGQSTHAWSVLGSG
eukprot:scaffold63816_cov63-Phaeocystis_antarctica.AAC.10